MSLYEERDIVGQGQFYSRHVDAMTREKLHSKAAIAAELGHRDQRICELEVMLLKWHEQQKERSGRGNAPGHGHSDSGIWDSDNGDLAGVKCAECSLWAEAERLAK